MDGWMDVNIYDVQFLRLNSLVTSSVYRTQSICISAEILIILRKKFCMKFGHLIIRKIVKFVATRCQISRLKCTKIVLAGAVPQTPLGNSQRSLDP